MPRRNDLHRILIIGSGPIVIGQACEFDYSGTQAAKALRADGYETILVNSNPATIMTDPDLAGKTYVEPLTLPYLEEIIRRERPDALLSTVGGQTALNLSVELAEAGILDKYGVELIGAKIDAIKKAEDRLLFKDAMRRIGLETPQSKLVNTIAGGLEFAARIGYPCILRPSFTLGGSGGGIAYNQEELASKATGFPIAKIAAKLAVGYRLDEIPNDITRKTPACFEPTIDYVVVKIPKWAFEKFPGADTTLGTQMKSVGEVMAIGRTFKEALWKGMRSLETGKAFGSEKFDPALIAQKLITPTPDRLNYIRFAMSQGYTVAEIHELTSIDPWFLEQMKEVVDFEQQLAAAPPTKELLRRAKRYGVSDAQLAKSWGIAENVVREKRKALGAAAG